MHRYINFETVSMDVLKLEDVDENDLALIEVFANATIEGDQRNYFYLDISLFKVVGQVETKLTSSLEPITISFILPETLRENPFTIVVV